MNRTLVVAAVAMLLAFGTTANAQTLKEQEICASQATKYFEDEKRKAELAGKLWLALLAVIAGAKDGWAWARPWPRHWHDGSPAPSRVLGTRAPQRDTRQPAGRFA